jgi:hypothetical protein
MGRECDLHGTNQQANKQTNKSTSGHQEKKERLAKHIPQPCCRHLTIQDDGSSERIGGVTLPMERFQAPQNDISTFSANMAALVIKANA